MIDIASANWSRLIVRAHFIAWGIWAHDENGSVLRVAITEREPHRLAWSRDIRCSKNHVAVTDEAIDEVYEITNKLERYWPCHFLAKEYNIGG